MDNKPVSAEIQEFIADNHPQGQDDTKASAFYQRIATEFGLEKNDEIAFIVVAHKVHTLPYFLNALSSLGDIASIIPKASQCVPSVEKTLLHIYKHLVRGEVNKESLKEAHTLEFFLNSLFEKYPGKRFVFIDHGGYFAPQVAVLLSPKFHTKIAGIIEHTWNGDIRYKETIKQLTKIPKDQNLPFPLLSIARSRLKAYEDDHVARSIVSALEAKVYSGEGLNQDTQNITIGIIGYGHIGAAVAEELQHRCGNKCRIIILDTNSFARKRAKKRFSRVTDNKLELLEYADLIICASSVQVLNRQDFALHIKNNAVVGCVTSGDDQITPDALEDFLISQQASKDAILMPYYKQNSEKKIYLVANGRSVNFLLGSTSHPILHAVLASVCVSLKNCLSPQPLLIKPQELTSEEACLPSMPVENYLAIEKFYEDCYGPIEHNTETFGLYALTCHFVGRAAELTRLQDIVSEYRYGVISQSIAGPGGIGKSTLALQCANLALEKKDYDYIIRLNAQNEEILFKEFLLLGEALGISYLLREEPQPKYKRPNVFIKEIYEYLKRYRRILIIFDDASKYSSLQNASISNESVSFLPPAVADQLIHYIVTTRNQQFIQDHHKVILLSGLQSNEAIEYIRYHLSSRPAEDLQNAQALATLLRGFPLALSQAVAYLKEHPEITVIDYITLYEKNAAARRTFLNSPSLVEDVYKDTVYTTWNISIEALKSKNPLSVTILNTLAYLADAAIPYTLINYIEPNPIVLKNALKYLTNYSLINLHDKNAEIHELVRIVSRLQQEEKNENIASLQQAMIMITNFYDNERSHLNTILDHCIEIIKSQDQILPQEACREKIKILLEAAHILHFEWLFSKKANISFHAACNIYTREHKNIDLSEYLITIYIGIANSASSAANPQGYCEALEQIFASNNLKVEHIETALRSHGIPVNWGKVKQQLLPIAQQILPPIFQSIIMQMPGRDLLQFFLGENFRHTRIQYVADTLAAIGFKALAIFYCLYKNNLEKAKIYAQQYYEEEVPYPISSKKIESIYLFVFIKIFSWNFEELTADIFILEEIKDILAGNPNFDTFWKDKIFFLLSILYAVTNDFQKSHDVIFSLFEDMRSFLASGDEGMKERMMSLKDIIEFLTQYHQPDKLNYFFAQAFRILGQVFNTLQEYHHAQNCFKRSLEFDENCALTYYEQALALYRSPKLEATRRDYASEVTALETAYGLVSTTKVAQTYIHASAEKNLLPKRLRSAIINAQNTPLSSPSLNALICSFLALLYCKTGDLEQANDWFNVLGAIYEENQNPGAESLMTAVAEKIAFFSQSTTNNNASNVFQKKSSF